MLQNFSIIRKQVKLSFFSLLLLLGMGCAKDNNDKPLNVLNNRGSILYTRISSLSDFATTQTAYSTLSDSDRYLFWQTRLQNLINAPELSDVQRSLIIELKDEAILEVFQTTDKREIFHNVWLASWLQKCKGKFSPQALYSIVFTIAPVQSSMLKSTSMTTMGDEGVGGATCICSVGSSFTCPHLSLLLGTIVFQSCTNVAGQCTQASRGCGALDDDKCNGDTCG